MKIKNTSRRMLTFTLEHGVVCPPEGKCGCSTHAVRGTTRELLVPDALTIAVGETVSVQDAVAELREVREAVARGSLQILEEPAGAPEPESSEAASEEPQDSVSADTQVGAGERRQGRGFQKVRK